MVINNLENNNICLRVIVSVKITIYEYVQTYSSMFQSTPSVQV